MKRSEMYRLAQGAIVNYQNIDTAMKLEILRELMAKEDLEIFCENKAKEIRGESE